MGDSLHITTFAAGAARTGYSRQSAHKGALGTGMVFANLAARECSRMSARTRRGAVTVYQRPAEIVERDGPRPRRSNRMSYVGAGGRLAAHADVGVQSLL